MALRVLTIATPSHSRAARRDVLAARVHGQSRRPKLSQEFEAFAALMHRAGVIKPWPRTSPRPRYHHTYLEIDGWEYWTMGEPIPETVLINRARLEDSE